MEAGGQSPFTLVLQIATLLSGVATPWLLIMYRKRQAALDNMVSSIATISKKFTKHKRNDQKQFNKLNKALTQIVTRLEDKGLYRYDTERVQPDDKDRPARR